MKRASDGLMQALDMPHDLKRVQDAYWLAQREWEKLDEAYRIVVSDMLERLSSQDASNTKKDPNA